MAERRLSHAYLFCGPRGTGKTTMARILAKALLCEKAEGARAAGATGCNPDGTCPECTAIAEGTHPGASWASSISTQRWSTRWPSAA